MASECPSGAVRLQRGFSFLDLLSLAVKKMIYTPYSVIVATNTYYQPDVMQCCPLVAPAALSGDLTFMHPYGGYINLVVTSINLHVVLLKVTTQLLRCKPRAAEGYMDQNSAVMLHPYNGRYLLQWAASFCHVGQELNVLGSTQDSSLCLRLCEQ